MTRTMTRSTATNGRTWIVDLVERMTSAICMIASESWDWQIVSDLPVPTYQNGHRGARPRRLLGV